MKKLLILLLILPLFAACSKDDDNKTPTQDYTSFVVIHNIDITLPNCVAAYKKDNKYYKLGDLGDLIRGKQSPEIRVSDNTITEVYIFTDYNGIIRFDKTYQLINNTKNIFEIKEGTGGLNASPKSDPTKYPQ